MKFYIIAFTISCISLPTFGQDTIPRQTTFDEGYFFVGPDDLLKFKGYVQFDGHFPVINSPGTTEFLMRRARFAATGFFQKKFRYNLEMGFDNGTPELRKAYLESRHVSFAKLRVGQYKMPFSPSNLYSSVELDLMERSFIVDNFSPGRDIGVMLFGDNKFQHFDYAIGVFNGQGANQKEVTNGKTIVGRLVLAPFASLQKTVAEKLFIGSSIAHGQQQNNFSLLSYSTYTGVPAYSFADSVEQNGNTSIYGYDIEWYIKSFSAKAEYLSYKTNLQRGTTVLQFMADGYYTTITYLLTGETKKRNGIIKPTKEFNPKKRQWGALELAARYEQTTLSNAALSLNIAKGTDKICGFTTGINWYLNDDVKVMLNYASYQFNRDVWLDGKNHSQSKNITIRVQYQF